MIFSLTSNLLRQRKRAGFTLIEFMVVLAIILLLVSLLLPLLAMSRDNAYRVTCTSNQRHITQAVMMWAQDHEETYPNGAALWKGMKFPSKMKTCPAQTSTGFGYDYSSFLVDTNVGNVPRPSAEIMIVDGIDNPILIQNMTVAANNNSWMATLPVSPGDQVVINASGFASYDGNVDVDNTADVTDPDGQRWKDGTAEGINYDPNATVPWAPLGALVGCINAAKTASQAQSTQPQPFLIGTGTQITVGNKGNLQLLYNAENAQYRHASGYYKVRVRVLPYEVSNFETQVEHNMFSVPEDFAFRHLGKALASYCDGHVALISRLPQYWMIDLAHESDFNADVLRSPSPVLVDFYAPWSPWCQQTDQMLWGIAQAYRGRVQVVKVNGDLYPKLVKHYQVTGYPTLTFFKKGEQIDVIKGYDATTKDSIISKLQTLAQ